MLRVKIQVLCSGPGSIFLLTRLDRHNPLDLTTPRIVLPTGLAFNAGPFYPAIHRPCLNPASRVRELPIRLKHPGTNRYRPTNAAIDGDRKASLISDVYASSLGIFRTIQPGDGADVERVMLRFQLVNLHKGVGQHSIDFSLAFDIVDVGKLQEYQPVSKASPFQIHIVLSSEFLFCSYIRDFNDRLNIQSLVIELFPEYCLRFPPLNPVAVTAS